MSIRRSGGIALAAFLAASACQDQEEPGLGEEEASVQNQIDIREVPLEVHRHAAQLLEDVRGTDSAPGWDRAVLATTVKLLRRPDVEGVAYYEFTVTDGRKPKGHIVASATEGDFPIAHWDFTGASPTAQLDQMARDRPIAIYYKLDTLAYAAEDERGELIANLGAMPSRISGQDPRWLDDPVPDTTATWVPDRTTRSDDEARGLGGKLVVEGPGQPRDIRFDSWDSWQQLKGEYRRSYETMIESLRRKAGEEWAIDALAAEFGEGLVEGQPFELALLYPKAEIGLDGEGRDLVDADVVESAPGREVLVLTARAARPGKETRLEVSIRYATGQSESKLFVVLSAEDTQGEEKKGGVAWADGALSAAWGPWNTFFAGTHNDQRLYTQIPAHTSPNTSGCYSGCGATAWAMLFGWGDFRAGSGDPGWSHRFGLYRANGGFGADAVAPKFNDTGIRNVQWEIRNRVGTFCAFGSGATFPWEMDDASGYLAGRTGATLTTNYNIFGIHTDGLRNTARDSIVYRGVPAIIGTGWLSHYPLAYGYRWRSRTVRTCFLFICWDDTEYQREFYVNQGWGGSGNGWVGAGTWFAGRLFAN
jgi:hypothetical protein